MTASRRSGRRRSGRPAASAAARFAVAAAAAVLLVLAQAAPAQSTAELQRKRRALGQQIATTNRLLASSAADRSAALDQLYGLQRQIAQRDELIEVMRLQLTRAEESLGRTDAVIASLEADLATLRGEYGRMARAALRQNLLSNRLSYLLSAESINDAFLRARYLRRYDENRRRQLELIARTRASLTRKLDRMADLREERGSLLAEEEEQQALREGELARANDLIASLNGDRARLRRDLARQRRERGRLDDAIAAVIAEAKDREDRRRAAQAAGRAAAQASEANAPAARADDYNTPLGTDFRSTRGRLPWPAEGYVAKPFGRQAHPTLEKVEVDNHGVDIRTDPGAEVRSVFEGEVVGLQQVPGYHAMVILQHGDYYTVYSRLTDVRVKLGGRIGTRDVLGRAAVDPETGASEVHFEVWRGKGAEDPVGWLR